MTAGKGPQLRPIAEASGGFRQSKKGKPPRDTTQEDWPAMSAMLPGAVHIVARAELFAVSQAVKLQGGHMELWTDHLPVVQVWRKLQQQGPAAVAGLANGDLWDDILADRPEHAHW